MTYQETSREAWAAFTPPLAASLDGKILAALGHAGRATCQEIEVAIDRDHQSVSGNLRHLVERGAVRASGAFGTTRSGRRAIRWELNPQTQQETA